MKYLSLSLVVLLIVGCKKDPGTVETPETGHEEELITTLTLTLEDSSGVYDDIVVTFSDPDGEGGNEPTQFDTIRLKTNTTYYGSIQLYNEAVTPVENLTSEILEEADEHLFCYDTPTNLSIQRTDSDGTFEIGLESTWKTTSDSLSNGVVTISLKHQPDIKNGTCTPGETDIELGFQLEISE